jgi:hypothetical protein
MGRPSSITPEIADRICGFLCEGRSLRSICEADDMPSRSAVMRHLYRDLHFRAQYVAAKAAGTEAMVEDARHMVMAATPEMANVVRVAADWTKWEVGRLNSKRWGDRSQHEVSGPNGGPLQIAPALPMVPREVAAGIKALLTKAEEAAGLPEGTGSNEERLQVVLSCGAPLHPDLYEALQSGDKG